VLIFEATRRLQTTPAPVAFIARNSLIIFLAHMPVYYLLTPVLTAWTTSYWTRVAIQLLVCLPILALMSEGIVAVVRPGQLRGLVFDRIALRRRPRGRAAVALTQRGTAR
jgi:peptidoglycan/LPS O-acetylase OafA/YrhL